jgi:lipid-binding SYLF domain-containing protein
VFAGVTINGSTVRQDRDAQERFYGRRLAAQPILFESQAGSPDPVGLWLQTLERHVR